MTRSFYGESNPLTRPAASPAPSPAHHAIGSAFRAWADAHALRIVEAERGEGGFRVVGRFAGRDVVVDPGIDRPVPGWTQLTIAVALSNAKPLLVTRMTRPADAATAGIRTLFEDAEVGPELRAVLLSPHHLRLRLAPGASPEVIAYAIRRVGDMLRELYASPEPRTALTSSCLYAFSSSSSSSRSSQPRQSCTATAPYPP